MNNKILFWPGITQDTNILKDLKRILIKNGYFIEYVKFKYDVGKLNPKKWDQVVNNKSDWWIGISLGASLLYYAYHFVPLNKRPKRITIINPFFSREILSYEKDFNIKNYWNFSPIKYKVNVNHIELVLSIFDKNIPIYHGLHLINSSSTSNKNIIFINSNHVIDESNAQKELGILLYKYKDGKYCYEKKLNYCNIYQQK